METFKDRNLMLVPVPEAGINFIIYMGYLAFKMPNYKEWVSDDVLANPAKLDAYLEKANPENQWLQSGIKFDYEGIVLGSYFPERNEIDFEVPVQYNTTKEEFIAAISQMKITHFKWKYSKRLLVIE